MPGYARCEVCGNEIDARLTTCPYCGEKREAEYYDVKRETLRVINLEKGMPPVADAIKRMAIELEICRRGGVRLMILIHGYGSSGTGGAIREAVRQKLLSLLDRKKIADVLKGEECYKNSPRIKKILKRFPEAKVYLQGSNPGITLVLLN